MKLCVDCRYCIRDFWGMKCAHPELPPMDYATGERKYADLVRQYGACGREARFFEPKVIIPPAPKLSLWRRLELWVLAWRANR